MTHDQNSRTPKRQSGPNMATPSNSLQRAHSEATVDSQHMIWQGQCFRMLQRLGLLVASTLQVVTPSSDPSPALPPSSQPLSPLCCSIRHLSSLTLSWCDQLQACQHPAPFGPASTRALYPHSKTQVVRPYRFNNFRSPSMPSYDCFLISSHSA